MPLTIEDLKKRAQEWAQKATEVRTPQFLKPLAGEYLFRREPEKAMAFPIGEGLRPEERIRAEAKIRELSARKEPKKAMVFPVGEGLMPEERVKTEEKIRKMVEEPPRFEAIGLPFTRKEWLVAPETKRIMELVVGPTLTRPAAERIEERKKVLVEEGVEPEKAERIAIKRELRKPILPMKEEELTPKQLARLQRHELWKAGMAGLEALPFLPIGRLRMIKKIPKELEPLAEEARKYKSAEEFVKKNLDILGVEEIRPLKGELKGKYGIKFKEFYGTQGEFSSKEEAIRHIAERRTIKGMPITDFYNQAVKEVKPKVIKPEVKKEVEKIGSQMEQARLKGFLQTVRRADRTTTELKAALGELDPYYKPLTNKGELQAAEMMIKKDFEAAKRMVLDPRTPVGGRKSATAVLLAKHYENIGDFGEAVRITKIYDQQLRAGGQFTQAASLWNKLTPRAILRAGEEVAEKYRMVFSDDAKKIVWKKWSEIQKMPEGIERDKATIEVMNFIAEQFPPRFGEIFDAFRYQNMLSSPRSHERNIWGNLLQVFIVRPLDLIGEWTYDIIRHPFNPAARDIKLADIKKHYQAVFKTIPEAIGAFKEGIRSGVISEKILETGMGREAETIIEAFRRTKLPRAVTMVTRFMEAQDRFFSTLIGAGEKARLMQKGIAEEIAEGTARELAEKYLFRERLGMTSKDQALMVRALDGLGRIALDIRDPKKYPLVSLLWSWAVPFVRTPINIAKFGVERSPLGFIGGTYQREQIGKALIGSIITGIGAALAMQDRTTWLPPIDPEAKRLFYDSGRKPMSVLIGDTWVPMYYFGPFVIALGLPAAIKYYTAETKEALAEEDINKIIKMVLGSSRIITEMTPVQGMSSFIKVIEGDEDYTTLKGIAYTAKQVIPFQGLLAYINTILDPVYRKSKTFTEALRAGLPGLTEDLPYYEKITGEPATRNWSDWFLPYSVGMKKEEFERLFKERILEMQMGYKEREILRKAGITEIKTKSKTSKAMTPSEWRKQMRKK